MAFEFSYPWLLLLLPAAVFILLFLSRGALRTLRQKVTFACRVAVVLCCVLALSMPQTVTVKRQLDAWALLDASHSADAKRTQMTESLKNALAQMKTGRRAGVIAFGRDAMVESAMSETPVFSKINTDVDAGGTDVSSALRLAQTLNGGASARAVLLSDGRFSLTDSQIAAFASSGMKVDGVRFSGDMLADAQVSDVAVPASVYLGQSFQVTVTLNAVAPLSGTLVLYQGNTPTATKEVTLRKGENTFIFNDTAAHSGTVSYTAKFQSANDAESANNALSACVRVTGQPSVLLVSSAEQPQMQKILLSAGMTCETVTPAALASSAEALRAYDAIVLDNVDYDAVRAETWDALKAAVRSLGRGLVVLGGDSAYALGGYRGTVIEDMLPVRIDVKNKLEMPALSLVLAIDKSGSMTEVQFGQTRLDLAKEAAMRSTEVLTPNDQVGVIAFDDTAKWVVPLQKAENAQAIQNLIGTIRPGGGTAFYSPLYAAQEALQTAATPQKHVIFLSDGDPGDAGFLTVITDMVKEGVTLTCVAVGSGANTELMRSMATAGGGRFYASTQFDDLPKIFTKETYLAGGSYVQNRTFTPVITLANALTDYEGFPSVDGYLTTVGKDTAQVYLASDTDDPLLAAWRYGAGTVAAWTSDVSGAWTRSFLAWDEAAAFFSGIVSSVLPDDTSAGTLTNAYSNGTLKLSYERRDKEAQGGGVTVTAVLPDGTEQTVSLKKTAAGVYDGTLPASQQGAYSLRVTDTLNGADYVTDGGAAVPYAEEYDLRLNADSDAFEKLVSLTGGTMYASDADYLSFSGTQARSRKDLTPLFTLLTLLLLLIDIALRRLPWDAALEKALNKRRQKAAEPAAPKAPDKQPKSPGRENAHRKKQREGEQAAQTADQLLSSLRDKKKL